MGFASGVPEFPLGTENGARGGGLPCKVYICQRVTTKPRELCSRGLLLTEIDAKNPPFQKWLPKAYAKREVSLVWVKL